MLQIIFLKTFKKGTINAHCPLSGGYIIAAQLVRKLTLKTEIVDQLIETVCKHPDDSLQEEQVSML